MFTTIFIPTRPQPDTIVAIFILKKYGMTLLPGIENASYKILTQVDASKTEEDYLREGAILIDVGGGNFDHHGKSQKTTASALVAEGLGVGADKSIQKLLAYAQRDDFYGKGTQSDDPLDKAFGLSGLIAALNKAHAADPAFVIESVLPLLQAHYLQEKQRTEEIPKELERIKAAGLFEDRDIQQKKNTLKVCFVDSDNVGLPGFLRATDGGRYDVVVQRRSTGHVNILTRPLKRPDLRIVTEKIRSEEFALRNNGNSYQHMDLLRLAGRNDDVACWYFDSATNSLLNGGVATDQVEPTKIPWDSLKSLVTIGISSAF